ncbi:metal ABC transporter solute-binding protein, Zn/Mn family [Peribacillus sp. SCS-26]|uniref:metal ABC transporter solute-binding protein, Zn/Mn family n=1 Tax=Paraperibacillus marinus TaxID=3115295 RepID=UPI0039062986
MKSKVKWIIPFLLTVLAVAGCSGKEQGNSKQEKSPDKIKVYATVYPLQYFAGSIGGKYVEAESVYPPGTDEHTFEPSQKDIIKMTDADLFLYVGHGLEGFVEKSKGILEGEDVAMAAIGEKMDLKEESHDDRVHEEESHDEHAHEEESHDEHAHGDIDPHVWLDPVLAKEMAGLIRDELAKQKPEEKVYFEENYTKLAAKLDALDKSFQKTAADAGRKELIVSHAAYGYWEKRYGIKQISVAGLSSSSEPSQKQLQKVVETAKKHDIKYVAFEQNVSSKLTETIQNEIGAAPLTLHNLSVLTEKDIKSKEDYFTLMDKNLSAVRTALNK